MSASSTLGSSCSSCSAIVAHCDNGCRPRCRTRLHPRSNVIGTDPPARSRSARENRGPRDVGAPRAVHGSRASRSDRSRGRPPPGLPGCRFCSAPLRHTFVDLGMSPLCESYVPPERLGAMEPFYPLHVRVCEHCLLVQLEELVAPEEIFTEYAYFSSYSDSWVAHARDYVESVVERFGLGADSQVVELASNDGYLLQHLVERGIPALGVEPAANVAEVARERGIETVVEFFGRELASRLVAEGRQADLLVGEQRVRPRSRPQRLHRRHAAIAGAARRDHDRVPSSGAADRGEPVRHHLPRALLLLLVPHRTGRASRLTASRFSTSTSCPRTAARCGCTHSGAEAPAIRSAPG